MSAQAITPPNHEISIVVGGQQIKGWETYEIGVSMLQPADHFQLRIPFDRGVWDLCKPDQPITVQIDDTKVLTGFIDEELVPEDDEVVEILGRCRIGRCIDESAPGINYAELEMLELIRKVATPWFTTITFSNARNRRVVRGRGKKAKAGDEPVKLFSGKRIGTHIEPGQSIWTVIESLCKQAGFIAFSSGDGTELIVGKPNYNQELQFGFFMPAADSTRTAESTVRGMGVHRSVTDRYSRVIAVGEGTGTNADYGATVGARYGEARNNPADPQGVGLDFTAPKRLIVKRSLASAQEALELATREMAVRDAHGHKITVRADGHGQTLAGAYTTLFAPDLLAHVEDERTGTAGTYIITACTFRSARKGGETTSLDLFPKGSELSS